MPSADTNHTISPPKKWPPVIKCVLQTITRYKMFSLGENVLIGVSGGPDSMALLHILYAVAPSYRLRLAIAHINHGLRSTEADKDESFVKQTAAKLNLPFYHHRINLKTDHGSIEEQARKARYAFFDEIMSHHGYAKVALGHQKNDNAEAVLLHLLRGSGIKGLSGIPPVRKPGVVRPLLHLDRAEIIDYLEANKIPFVTDATNIDLAYDRNRIRHHLIPLLEKDYKANITEILNRTADLCWEEESWLNHYLQPKLNKTIIQFKNNCLKLDFQVLATEPLAVQRRLVREAMNQWLGHLKRMGACHINTVLSLPAKNTGEKRVSLPYGVKVKCNSTHLCFYKGNRRHLETMAKQSPFCYTIADIDHMPFAINIPESGYRVAFKVKDHIQTNKLSFHDEDRTWFDIDDLSFPLRIRNFKPGDRIQPYGMKGSQKIKKLFIDRKINVSQRHKIALLESQGTILWVIGIRRGNQAVVSNKTRRTLEVRVFRFNGDMAQL